MSTLSSFGSCLALSKTWVRRGSCQLPFVKGIARVLYGQVYGSAFDETPLVPAPVQLHVKKALQASLCLDPFVE